MTQYNKILTTVNSVTSNYNFTPDLSNLIVIDTSNNRIGINKVNPEYSIDVSSGLSDPSGTIRCGTLRVDQIIGRTASMEDLYLGSNTLYIDGIPALGRDENKKLIIGDVSGKSTLSSVDIDGSLNINGNLDICNGSIFLNGFKTITKNAISNKILIENNGGIDISGTVSFLNVPSFSGGQPAQNDADIAGGYIYNTPIGYTGTQIVADDGYFVTTQTNDVKVKNRITFSDNLATSFGSPLLSANFDSVDVSNHLTVRNGDASFNNAVKIGGHLIGTDASFSNSVELEQSMILKPSSYTNDNHNVRFKNNNYSSFPGYRITAPSGISGEPTLIFQYFWNSGTQESTHYFYEDVTITGNLLCQKDVTCDDICCNDICCNEINSSNGVFSADTTTGGVAGDIIFRVRNTNNCSLKFKSNADGTISSFSPNLSSMSGNYDLGRTSRRWKTLYATIGTINTSDDRLKINERPIEQATTFINTLNIYEYEKVNTLNGTDVTNTERGLLAQDLLNTDLSYIVYGGNTELDDDGKEIEIPYGVRYNDLFVTALQAIQELHQRIKFLEEKFNK